MPAAMVCPAFLKYLIEGGNLMLCKAMAPNSRSLKIYRGAGMLLSHDMQSYKTSDDMQSA